MEFLEGLCELPGALFRKLFTARNKSFDEILKEETKNKLTGLCLIISALVVIIIALAFLL
jgi:hypothetical protein